MTNNKANAGFTLIELSIVLVIIGLIVSGVLAGQELIHGASVRATISQVLKYNTAVATFQMKYNAIPGDFNAASNFIATTAVNGDGNGLIGSVAGSATPATAVPAGVALTASGEYGNFWSHLSSIGLVEGSYGPIISTGAVLLRVNTNFPASKVASGVGIIAYGNSADNYNHYHLGVKEGSAAGTAVTTSDFLSPGDAYSFDAKVDDGLPSSGIVVARSFVAGVIEATPPAIFNATLGNSTSCIIGASYSASTGYNTAAPTSSNLCQLRMRITQG
jgi:prepilin-type N-terminal cleavage/methylation domain-containing protein